MKEYYKITCDHCSRWDFIKEYTVERAMEKFEILGWKTEGEKHYCTYYQTRKCQK